MTTTKRVIGKVPIFRGTYEEGKEYFKYNIVTWMGSSFISLEDKNANVPATIENDSFVLGEGWDFIADASNAYILPMKDVDISQDVFDNIPESELDPNKTYYIYE